MAELQISPSARADLIVQWDFFADDMGNPELADSFIASARATFFKWARTPGLGRVRSFQNPKAKDLRSWKVEGFPKHLIRYQPSARRFVGTTQKRAPGRRTRPNDGFLAPEICSTEASCLAAA